MDQDTTEHTPEPHMRHDFIAAPGIEAAVRRQIDARALSNSWIIAGPSGIGKATFAFRIARALLEPNGLLKPDSLAVSPTGQAAHLIGAAAHPDLFVARREWDEKTSKFKKSIAVDTIRALINFMHRTPSMGAWRVAIIDPADELQPAGANALLKVLEEPPEKAVLLLVANTPGRLLATIRSRCRRIDLRSVEEKLVAKFVTSETGVNEANAAKIAAAARGRPGFALSLAGEEGTVTLNCVEAFLKATRTDGDFSQIAGSLNGRGKDGQWALFVSLLLEELSEAARDSVSGQPINGSLAGVPVSGLLEGWEKLGLLAARGNGLNLDRAQLIQAMGYDLRAILRGQAA